MRKFLGDFSCFVGMIYISGIGTDFETAKNKFRTIEADTNRRCEIMKKSVSISVRFL